MEEKKLTNRLVQICYFIATVAYVGSQIGEAVHGVRTPLFVVVFTLFLVTPFIVNEIVYLKSPGNKYSKHIVAIGYGAFYIFAMLTAVNPLTFMFAVPMLCVMILYQEWIYSLSVGIAVLIVNLAYIIILNVTDKVIDSSYFEIEMGSLVLVTIFTTFATKLTADISKHKLEVLNKEKSQQADTIQRIEDGSDAIKKNIYNLKKLSDKVKHQSQKSTEAIDEITLGTAEVAENIQKQLERSTEITRVIDESNELMQGLAEQFKSTIKLSNVGYDNMNNLADISDVSMKSFEQVKDSAQELSLKIDKARQILDIISGITSQTALLSLNASIEAARAGENGKGFAVVATEMQQLATETQSATEEITKIFDELGEQNNISNKTIADLQDVTMQESEIVNMTKENFNKIKTDLSQVSEHIETQIKCADKIQESNNVISANIEDMSAFTEELTASSEASKELIIQSMEDTVEIDSELQQVYEQTETLR